jgi:hypothetical protein
MDDPTAERRDYGCSAGACTYSVAETRDCNPLDGWYGGGNTPGCGVDPASQQRDYYVAGDGSCAFTTTSCLAKSCDYQDECSTPQCDGSLVRSYLDAYVVQGMATCTSVFGSVVEDCSTKASTDSDGGATAYDVGGTVNDFSGCAGGACLYTAYADTCAGNILTEYAAVGASLTSTTYDCESAETYYCKDGRYRWRNERVCQGVPGACADAPDTMVADCGSSGCAGLCGTGMNGCAYHERGCAATDCTDTSLDADQGSTYCTACGAAWALGGEVAASACCGDDSGEHVRTCNDNSDNGSCGTDLSACCAASSDCVDHSGACRDAGACHVFGTGGKKSYCGSGTWQDPDSGSVTCTAAGCGFSWLAGAAACCGDDGGGDDIEQPSSGSSCCFNGSLLGHGTSSGRILCFDGELFDCGGGATDDSGLAAHKVANDYLGNYQYTCTATNLWCARGYADCDGLLGNGCERHLDNDAGACGDNPLGTVEGDNSSGMWCSGHCVPHSTLTGWGEKWYQINVQEASSCCADVTLGVTLDVPADVDYDVEVYTPCGTLQTVGAAGGLGQDERIHYVRTDGNCLAGNDGFTAQVRVVYFRGVGCGDWSLRLYGGVGCY